MLQWDQTNNVTNQVSNHDAIAVNNAIGLNQFTTSRHMLQHDDNIEHHTDNVSALSSAIPSYIHSDTRRQVDRKPDFIIENSDLCFIRTTRIRSVLI